MFNYEKEKMEQRFNKYGIPYYRINFVIILLNLFFGAAYKFFHIMYHIFNGPFNKKVKKRQI